MRDVPELPEARPLDWRDQDWLAARLATDPARASELTFTNLWSWSGTHPALLGRVGETLLIWRGPVERGGLLAPSGPPLDRDGVRRALDWAAAHGGPARFIRVPEAAAHALTAADRTLVATADRDQADYVYRREDLATLAGRGYDGKRNLIKKFRKSVNAVYVPLDAALAAECLALQREWCEARGCSEHPDLDAEDQAVCLTLERWRELPVIGGALLVEGAVRRIAAFAVAERLNADTAVMHFEKGSTLYPGVYQAINQEMCANALGEFEFVNREQDLGLEGLRQAKLSYHPVRLVEKFVVQPA